VENSNDVLRSRYSRFDWDCVPCIASVQFIFIICNVYFFSIRDNDGPAIKGRFHWTYLNTMWRMIYQLLSLTQVDADAGDSKSNNKVRSTAVRIAQINNARVRFVTHKNITDKDLDMAIEKIKYVIEKIDKSCGR